MVAEGVWVVLAASLAIAVPGVIAGLGVGMTGVTCAAIAGEDPKKAYRVFVYEVMPGTQGFYGFVAGFLIILGTGLSAGAAVKSGVAGLAVLCAAVPAILQGFTSYPQGMVASASATSFAKRPEVFAAGMMYTVMVEIYAILGLLATILLLTFIGAL